LQYTSRIYSDGASNYQIGAVALLNGGFGIDSVKHNWSVEVWCLNCADRRYYTVMFPATLQTGTEDAYVGLPRTFGMSLRGHF
jgi:iron complex outermembrane receptor protein